MLGEIFIFWTCILIGGAAPQYKPTWNSLDQRTIPSWYDDSKLGIFVSWGLFSVPAYGSEWFWEYWQGQHNKDYVEFMRKNYRPDFTYSDFADQFSAEMYDPEAWAEIFSASGAKYIVFISKHHDGFTNWPSKYSFNWNSMDVGPKRDLLGELATALRNKTDIKFGVYHSLFEWFNPLYLQDKANKFQTQDFVARKTMPELYELVKTYKPEVIWSDGDWEAPDSYWNSTNFIAWLYNDSPVKDAVVTNDRWGSGVTCHHGDFYTCSDRYNPGHLVKHKWENAMTIDSGSWGYRRNVMLSSYLTSCQLINELVSTVSCGGNLLMNVGPTSDGRIIPIFEERLRDIGAWLNVNGDAIYGTTPWMHQRDTKTTNVWYVMKKSDRKADTIVYAIVLEWPDHDVLHLGAPNATSQSTVTMLGVPGQLQWSKATGGGIDVMMPQLSPSKVPCKCAWALALRSLAM